MEKASHKQVTFQFEGEVESHVSDQVLGSFITTASPRHNHTSCTRLRLRGGWGAAKVYRITVWGNTEGRELVHWLLLQPAAKTIDYSTTWPAFLGVCAER